MKQLCILFFCLIASSSYALTPSLVTDFTLWKTEQEANCSIIREDNGNQTTLIANANCGGNIQKEFKNSLGILANFNIQTLTEDATIGFGKQIAVIGNYRIFVQMDIVRRGTTYSVRCQVQRRNESSELLKKLMFGEFEMIPTNQEVQMGFTRQGNSVIFFVLGEDGMIRWDAFSQLIHVDRGFYIYTHAWGDQQQAQTLVKDLYILYE